MFQFLVKVLEVIAMIYVNDVFRLENGQYERLLWTDGTVGYFINIFNEKAFPVRKSILELENEIDKNQAVRVDIDPAIRVYSEETIPEKHKAIRDKVWEFMKELTAPDNEPQIFKADIRWDLIRKTMEQCGVDKNTIYKHLRNYWRKGKIKNAFLPNYANSGGRGKIKAAGDKKRGRPRKFRESLGEGVNVTPEDIAKFEKALGKYYYVRNGHSLVDVYKMMLADSYVEDVRYDENGVKLPILKHENSVPSMRQFLYWFTEKVDIERSLRSRKGNKNFELNERPILNSSADEGLWATYKYQIDATIGDIYLRSAYNPQEIIGRPVIYLVVDVFSRMITGYYVGLEGPSWLGMSMALANAMMDKVSFCAKYGIQITPEEWPCHFVPESIMCDRGEGEGKAIETACQSLNIRIENAAPYRADWKGIVERYFKTTNDCVKKHVPGAVLPDHNTRMGEDYRLDATFDLHHFNKFTIKFILFQNNQHYMSYYIRNNEVFAEGVKPIPRDLWNWSIEKMRPRVFEESYIILSLMPRDRATVTGDGIKFKKLIYTCEKAIQKQWFLKAKLKGFWKIDISYDPRNMDYLYIWDIGSDKYEVCTLAPSQKNYMNQDIDDLEYLFAFREYEKGQREQVTRQAEADFNASISQIISEAKKKVPQSNESKSAQIKDIRTNRKREKERNREDEGFLLTSEESHDWQKNADNSNEVADIFQEKENEQDKYSFPKKIDLLKRKLKERKDGDKGKG